MAWAIVGGGLHGAVACRHSPQQDDPVIIIDIESRSRSSAAPELPHNRVTEDHHPAAMPGDDSCVGSGKALAKSAPARGRQWGMAVGTGGIASDGRLSSIESLASVEGKAELNTLAQRSRDCCLCCQSEQSECSIWFAE